MYKSELEKDDYIARFKGLYVQKISIQEMKTISEI
jgi:hypothetical protein